MSVEPLLTNFLVGRLINDTLVKLDENRSKNQKNVTVPGVMRLTS